jgi:hypothetical protein
MAPRPKGECQSDPVVYESSRTVYEVIAKAVKASKKKQREALPEAPLATFTDLSAAKAFKTDGDKIVDRQIGAAYRAYPTEGKSVIIAYSPNPDAITGKGNVNMAKVQGQALENIRHIYGWVVGAWEKNLPAAKDYSFKQALTPNNVTALESHPYVVRRASDGLLLGAFTRLPHAKAFAKTFPKRTTLVFYVAVKYRNLDGAERMQCANDKAHGPSAVLHGMTSRVTRHKVACGVTETVAW